METPFTTTLDYNEYTGTYKAEGSFQDLLNTLSNTMNFTYTIQPPPDNKWGGLQPDGSWNGMIHQVINRKTDFGNRNNTQQLRFMGTLVFLRSIGLYLLFFEIFSRV